MEIQELKLLLSGQNADSLTLPLSSVPSLAQRPNQLSIPKKRNTQHEDKLKAKQKVKTANELLALETPTNGRNIVLQELEQEGNTI